MKPAPEFVPSPYAGRNQISLDAAAGKRTEADGGSARETEWGARYFLRFGSVGNDNYSEQTFPTSGNFESQCAAEGRRACNASKTRAGTASESSHQASCRRPSCAAEACRAGAHALGFAAGVEAQGK